MSDLAKKFIEEALLLPNEDRAELVEHLLKSLNIPAKEEIDKLWAEEVEKRVREYEQGKIKVLDGEQVIKEIRNKYSS
jgi:putative addiction module component (TIGR02574 family)